MGIGKNVCLGITAGLGILGYIFSCSIFFVIGCAAPNADKHIEQGNSLAAAGDDAAAVVEFEKAIELYGSDPRLRKVAADTYFRIKDYDAALRHLDAAVAILKNDFQKYSKLALTERDAEQAEFYRQLVETRIAPFLSEIYVAQAGVYAAVGSEKAFSIALEAALLYNENNLVARKAFAEYLESKGEFERALKEWTIFLAKAKQLTPDDKEMNGITNEELMNAANRISALLAKRSQERERE